MPNRLGEDAIAAQSDRDSSARKRLDFTPRELSIIALLREGKPNKVIAYELQLQEGTVKVHIRNIMKKLNAANRTQVALLTDGVFDDSAPPLLQGAAARGERSQDHAPDAARETAAFDAKKADDFSYLLDSSNSMSVGKIEGKAAEKRGAEQDCAKEGFLPGETTSPLEAAKRAWTLGRTIEDLLQLHYNLEASIKNVDRRITALEHRITHLEANRDQLMLRRAR